MIAGVGCFVRRSPAVNYLSLSCMTEAAAAPFSHGRELRNAIQFDLDNRLEHQLRNSIPAIDPVGLRTIVCKDNANFAVVVCIDNTDALRHPDTVSQRKP